MAKRDRLEELIKSKERVLVAFSGGVDSSVLAALSYRLLGDNAVAVTIDSPTIPDYEVEEAKEIAKEIGVRHVVVEHHELDPVFKDNPVDRCYHCRKAEIAALQEVAAREGFTHILAGTNTDDYRDYRPGIKALKESGVSSPLAEAGYTKSEVRELARELGLPKHSKPAMACLASRIPYGEPVTEDKLDRVAKAEKVILDLGVEQVRVRSHQDLARIEVDPSDLQNILESKGKLVKQLKRLGFSYVTLDLQGYRTGSLNEVIK